MATRFYLPSFNPPPISPAIAGTWWAAIPAFARYNALTTKTFPFPDPMTTIAYSTDTDSTNNDYCFGQWISAPIAAQTIAAQQYKFQMRGIETSTSNNLYFSLSVRVVSNDGSVVRGTLIGPIRGGVELSATVLQNRQFVATIANQVVAQANDRIVIEIGLGGDPATGYYHRGSIRIGDASEYDLPEDTTSTLDYCPWFQFPNDISWPAAGVTVTPSPATAVSATVAPTVIKGSLTISGLIASAISSAVGPLVRFWNIAQHSAVAISKTQNAKAIMPTAMGPAHTILNSSLSADVLIAASDSGTVVVNAAQDARVVMPQEG